MSLTPIRPSSLVPEVVRPDKTPSSDAFKEALMKAGAAVVQPQQEAARAVDIFARGAGGNLHETLLAVDKAEISMKFLVTMRNRILEAYREVMRMGM